MESANQNNIFKFRGTGINLPVYILDTSHDTRQAWWSAALDT